MSRYYGMNRFDFIHKVLRYALITMIIISVLIYSIVFFGAGQITQIFNSEHNAVLQTIATNGLQLYFIACPFAGFTLLYLCI